VQRAGALPPGGSVRNPLPRHNGSAA